MIVASVLGMPSAARAGDGQGMNGMQTIGWKNKNGREK
jgi:hypothetical protein